MKQRFRAWLVAFVLLFGCEPEASPPPPAPKVTASSLPTRGPDRTYFGKTIHSGGATLPLPLPVELTLSDDGSGTLRLPSGAYPLSWGEAGADLMGYPLELWQQGEEVALQWPGGALRFARSSPEPLPTPPVGTGELPGTWVLWGMQAGDTLLTAREAGVEDALALIFMEDGRAELALPHRQIQGLRWSRDDEQVTLYRGRTQLWTFTLTKGRLELRREGVLFFTRE